MWILDTDSQLLGGIYVALAASTRRRIWLRPGAESILGRTNYSGTAPKSISRRHVILTVEAVPEGQGLSIRHHSKLTLKDESKKGSTVDGEFINNNFVVLDEATEHMLQMASAIKYEPQIFTIHIGGKKKANLKTGLKEYLDKLEQLDIKCVAEFLPGKTTVAVVTKRNLPISLRALVNGAWIVTSTFVDAIVTAATRPLAANGDPLDSPLQSDISANWPNPLDYLPPPGAEPNPKGPEFFKPNPARKTMFEKWTVVCCTAQHMDIFTGVVTDAGGKIELFEITEGRTKPAELIVHLEKLGPRYVVLAPNTDDDWSINFRSEVEARTSVRFAVQNEFLDAILLADPKVLRRDYEPEVPVHESVEIPSAPPADEIMKESQPVTRRTRGRGQKETVEAEVVQPVEPAPASTESSMRRTTSQSRTSRYVSQIKIDDSDDDNFVPLPAPPSSSTAAKPTSFKPTTSRGVSFSQAKGTQLTSIAETQTQSQGVKRRSLPSDDEDEEFPIDKILPGQAAMKRRKIEEKAKKAEPSKPAKQLPSFKQKAETPAPIKPEPIPEEDEEIDIKPAKGKKKAVDSAVIKTAQEIRRKEEAKAALEDAANEMTPEEIAAVAKMRDLAIVEVFDIIPRTDRPVARSQAYGDESSRWEERWNGRKNFKKFKRRTRTGDLEGPMRRIGGQIMVPLVEHRARDYGIGESYWLESTTSSRRQRNNQSSNVSHISETQVLLAPVQRGSREVQEISSEDDDDGVFPGEYEVEEVEEEDETNPDDSAATRRSQQRPRTQDTQASSMRGNTRFSVRNATPVSSTLSRSKRTTSNRNSVSEEPAKKRAKTKNSLFINDSDEDSDEDELKFKFK
ncbi:hypothetical protein Dda_3126 [Drechslerella dactyloides]|uniref:FHA domain-containing protein n=1 Tax=Drechslerella dactyloides TaxID=74499 RepID=A0AAD6J0S2_DREDA|nr:hypothetical protein Dda_3126 [Drechslerella dactyloides]